MFMYWNDANPLADRFAWLIDELCKAIGRDAHKCRMEAALAWAIWIRVRLLGDRLIALAERVKGGRFQITRPGGARRASAGPRAPRSRQGQCSAVAGLPQDFGWIRRLLPETAQYAGVLRYLLRDPEMAALLVKAPQARRVLRPLCLLLGVKAPELPRRNDAEECAPLDTAASSTGAEGDAPADVGVAVDPSPRPTPARGDGEEAPLAPEPAPTPGPPQPQRPRTWLEEDALAMRERAARWVARHPDAPSTVLPLGLPRPGSQK
jgi:hypothetical protein